MDYTERSKAVNCIVNGKHLISYRNENYIYIEPDPETLWMADIQYLEFYDKYSNDSAFMSAEEAMALLEREGLWSEQDEQSLKEFEENLETLRRSKGKYKFQSRHLSQVESLLEETERNIQRLRARKTMFNNQTYEYQAKYSENCWVLAQCLYDLNQRRVWGSYDEFMEESDMFATQELVIRIFYDGIYSLTDLRKLARSEPWRSRWRTANKTSTSLFNTPYLTGIQHSLCYWSNVYDSVYESMDCPTNDVIEDDEELDAWFEIQARKNDERAKERANKDKVSSSMGASADKFGLAQEVFVKVDTAEDARRVYNELNSVESRNILRERERAIATKGKVKEAFLPDVKKEIDMKLTQLASEAVKGRSK